MKYFFSTIVLVLVAACGGRVEVMDNEQVSNRGAGKDQWWHALPRAGWQRYTEIQQSQDWFDVYEVAAGIYAIYEPGQFEEVISYLITGTDAALLFDTGLGIGDINRLTRELTDLEVSVLNSHSHYDHIGGNYAFGTILAANTAFTRRHAAGLEHAEVREAVGPGWIWKPTPSDFDRASYRVRPYAISRFVRDGERIDLGGRILEVLLTPGHSPDSLCLIDRANRLLFTGDTFYPAPLYTHLEGSDFHAYVATAHRLAALSADVDLLMPGHNEPAVDAGYLDRLAPAFDAIAAGKADYILTDGNREYAFDGFSIITGAEPR